MFNARTSLAVIAIAGSLGFAGCGDDDDETTTTTTSGATGATGASGAALSTDLAAQGNEICKQGDEELNQVFSELQNAKPTEQEELITNEVIPNIQGQIDDLRDLSDSEELASALDNAESILDDLEADPASLFEGDAFAEVNEELSAIGLDDCAD